MRPRGKLEQRAVGLGAAACVALLCGALAGRAAAQTCTGDCDQSGVVAINELILGVNIALGSAQVSVCQAFDRDGDGSVSISELVDAVNRALAGCTQDVAVSGVCLRPGTTMLEPCGPGTAVRALRCDAAADCLGNPASTTELDAGTVGADGTFALQLDGGAVEGELLIFEGEVDAAAGTSYRVMDFGPIGSSAARRPHARGTTAGSDPALSIVLSPATEAAVRLLADAGLELFTADGIRAVLAAVAAATVDTSFAGLTPAAAADHAEAVAAADPAVQNALESGGAPTPTPTATTASGTPTATATLGADGADDDGDGISNGEELAPGLDGFVTNPRNADTDGDGSEDGAEVTLGTDPTQAQLVDLVIDARTVELSGHARLKSLTLSNGAILTHPPTTTSAVFRVEVDVAETLTVDAGSRIDVSGRGFVGGHQGGNGSTAGLTLGNTVGSTGRNGGGYGGPGGRDTLAAGVNPGISNAVYGDFRDPNEPGSGGGSEGCDGAAGNGGGLVRLSAATLDVDGRITANGQAMPGCGGGGSGGGITLVVGTLRGHGRIESVGAGGGGGSTPSGGGGGGRVAISYQTNDDFDFANVNVSGGSGEESGGSGSLFVRQGTQPLGELTLRGGSAATPLYSLRGAASTGLSANALTDSAANFIPNALMGLQLNPNPAQGKTFRIIANTGTTLTTDPADGSMTAVAAVGDPYASQVELDRLLIANTIVEVTDGNRNLFDRRGSLRATTLEVRDALLTQPISNSVSTFGLELDVPGTLTVDPFGRIDVSGRGFVGGHQGGNGSTAGLTLGNTVGSTGRNGGGYGGPGGRDTLAAGVNPGISNAVYGDFRDPNEPGSGGGSEGCDGIGGSGGGLVRLSAGTLDLGGRIASNGQAIPGCGGGGSGGGITLVVGTLRGGGRIESVGAGGGGGSTPSGGGGGGRVAISYQTNDGFDLNSINVNGGSGEESGGSGSLFLRQGTQPLGELTLRGGSAATPLYSLRGAASTGLSANALTDSAANFIPNALMGLQLNPNPAQGKRFRIIANTATTLTTDPADGSMTAVAAVGDPYASQVELDRLLIANTIVEVTDGNRNLFDRRGSLRATTLEVRDAMLTHPISNSVSIFGLELDVSGTLTVDPFARIDVTGRGFVGGHQGGNGSEVGLTLGNTVGSTGRNGGGYGGLGGAGSVAGASNPTYGDPHDPNQPGSGGGSQGCDGPGGNGGGLVRLSAATLDLGGRITANGQSIPACGGGGSGGGIKLVVGALRGNGRIESVGAGGGGGSVTDTPSGGGGGGRIAVFYGDATGFLTANITAERGSGEHDGEPGTIVFEPR